VPTSKILGRGGTSLADLYDVEGSIVGVERLDSEEVKTVHEMGATIFSERLGGQIHRMAVGNIAQSTSWDGVLDFTAPFVRILNVIVISNQAARVQDMVVSLNDPGGSDLPIWAWETGSGDDREQQARIELAGTVAVRTLYRTGEPYGPSMLVGPTQTIVVAGLRFRGITTAFGAGTVSPIALIMTGSPALTSLPDARGLPVPSW